MRTRKITLLIIAIFSLLISCNSEEDNLTKVGNLILIGQGNLYGNGEENIEKQNLVISNTSSWKELMNKMNSVNNESSNFIETDIDFSKFMIIAVFDNVKGNGGHSIDITKIEENNNNIFVSVEYLLPGGFTTIMTQPYHIIKITKKNKPVIFE